MFCVIMPKVEALSVEEEGNNTVAGACVTDTRDKKNSYLIGRDM